MDRREARTAKRGTSLGRCEASFGDPARQTRRFAFPSTPDHADQSYFPLRVHPSSCTMAKMALMDQSCMKSMSARDAKNRFGLLIDTARQEPVSIEKHGRPVVIVLSIEDYERLSSSQAAEHNGDDRDGS